MAEPTDDQIVAWADGFIRQQAFNRPVACQIAIEAAKWVRGQITQARDVDGLMALVYLYGAHCAEHPEDAEGAREKLGAIRAYALGVNASVPPVTGDTQ